MKNNYFFNSIFFLENISFAEDLNIEAKKYKN